MYVNIARYLLKNIENEHYISKIIIDDKLLLLLSQSSYVIISTCHRIIR